MKKFEFSLSRMLDYKDRLLDEELGVLQRLKGEQAAVEEEIGRLEREFQRLNLKLRESERQGTTILEARTLSQQMGNIRLQLAELAQALEAARQRVERQTKVVVAANQEVSKLDKLQDRQYESYRQQADKAEQLRIEELVVQRLTRQGAG